PLQDWASSPVHRSRTGHGSLFEQRHGFSDGLRGAVQLVALLAGQLDLDDTLQATTPELARHAEEEAVEAVLTLEPGRARKDALLVPHDRLDHLHGGGGR